MGKRITRSELLDRLVTQLPSMVWQEYEQKDTCIPASYHAYETLRAQKIPARLETFDVIAMNWPFYHWLETLKPEDDHQAWPDGAWAVGVAHKSEEYGRAPYNQDFHSHLVVVTKGKLLDCSTGQLSRPQHDMPVPDGLLLSGREWQDETTVVSYTNSPEAVPPMWRNNPWATERVRERIAEEILR